MRHALGEHVVETAYERGWSSLKNGDLIAAAEAAGFAVLVTTDKSLKYQQNLSTRRLAVVVLLSTSWPRMQEALASIASAVDGAAPGSYVEVPIG